MEVGEMSVNLYSLYEFMSQKLLEANMKKEKEPLIVVHKLIADLSNTWEQMLSGQTESHQTPVEEEQVDDSEPQMAYSGGIDFSG